MQNTTKTADAAGLRSLWQLHPRWFLGMTVAGLALRLFFLLRLPNITPDSMVYGDIAKNWLLHHVYGLTAPHGVTPTFIRLPGYPAFLAALWAVFGMEHYNAVRFAQVIMDLGTCFLAADLARRVVADSLAFDFAQRVARWAFALTALCPFLANYTAVPLTETPAIFATALALDLAVAALQRERDNLRLCAACGLAIAAGNYLRPDNGITLVAIGGYLLYRLTCKPGKLRTFCAGLVLAVFSLLPLAPWTARNWREFHRFQPLAPTHAQEPGEYFAYGFQDWMRTWLVDYASLDDIGFRVDGEELDFSTLPNRAFDNADERRQTEELFNLYNENVTVTPELDAQFEQLARQRIQRRPFRYYVVLPLLRAADLWLRPRTEMLPIDSHWWRWREDFSTFAWSLLLAAINVLYLALAWLGVRRWREIRYAGMLAAFVVARTMLITVLTYPEPRYVLQCYPAVIAFAAIGLLVCRPVGQSVDRSEYVSR